MHNSALVNENNQLTPTGLLMKYGTDEGRTKFYTICLRHGGHSYRKSASRCDHCELEPCEICGSEEHRTGVGHDLSNPRYWGV